MRISQQTKLALVAIWAGMVCLHNRRLDDREREVINGTMPLNFDLLDKVGIPFRVQNAFLAAGESDIDYRQVMTKFNITVDWSL